MTSILTNSSALNAASALAATQRSLATTQQKISTGLRVSSAADDPTYWSIAQGMQTRIGNLKAVNDGLSLTSAIIGITGAALSTIVTDVQTIGQLVIEAQTSGADKAAIQTEIGLRQHEIVATAGDATLNGVNWLVTRQTGTYLTREDATNSFPQAEAHSNPVGLYTSVVQITDTATLTQTLGSTSSSVTTDTSISTATPNATLTQETYGSSDTKTTTGDPLGYRNVSVLLSPDSTTQIDLHPIELFDTFVGTTQSLAYGSFSDVPLYQYGQDPTVHPVDDDPYISYQQDDDLDATIHLPDVTCGETTVLDLDVTKASPADFANLTAGIGQAMSSLVSGQSFLGGMANEVTGQQTYNGILIDALQVGVGSLVDADMDKASTQLTALQTQQQLGLQALSVANTNAKAILRLFDSA